MTRMNRFLTSVALVAGAALAFAQEPQAPPTQPPVTFRAEVNYVEVDARVLDDQGAFVPGLTGADFQVFEDGKPQKVTAFSLVNIPVERQPRPLFASSPIEPDVQNNLNGYDGRIYVIMLDDQHTHPLRAARTKAAARQFIQRYMGANDTAAVVFTSGRSDAAQEFTNSQQRLLASVDKFTGRKLRSSTLERLDEEVRTRDTRQQGDRIDDMLDNERGLTARTTLESIRNLANYLGGISGRRKAIVYFSEGIDYDITDVFNNRSASSVMDATREAIAAATRANVAIYGVDPRGLGAGSDEMIEVGGLPEDNSLNLGSGSFVERSAPRAGQPARAVAGDRRLCGREPEQPGRQLRAPGRRQQRLLPARLLLDQRTPRRQVPQDRGARVASWSDRPRPQGLRGGARPGRDREGRPENGARTAGRAGQPAAGVGLAAGAGRGGVQGRRSARARWSSRRWWGRATCRSPRRTAPSTTTSRWCSPPPTTPASPIPADRATLALNLKPDSVPRLRAGGFRILNQIDLPPGRYQLEVAARESNTSRAGSVTYDLDVPDFSKEKLSISGLALTSASSGLTPTARPKDPLAKMLPGPMTTYREFTAGDELALFVEVYDNSGKQPHKVDIEARLLSEGGQAVFQTREERDSSELAGGPGGYGFSARIPLKEVPPGLYVLRVTGKTRVGDQAEAARETIVRVLAPPGK